MTCVLHQQRRADSSECRITEIQYVQITFWPTFAGRHTYKSKSIRRNTPSQTIMVMTFSWNVFIYSCRKKKKNWNVLTGAARVNVNLQAPLNTTLSRPVTKNTAKVQNWEIVLSLRENCENRARPPLMTRCYQNVVSLPGMSHFYNNSKSYPNTYVNFWQQKQTSNFNYSNWTRN